MPFVHYLNNPDDLIAYTHTLPSNSIYKMSMTYTCPPLSLVLCQTQPTTLVTTTSIWPRRPYLAHLNRTNSATKLLSEASHKGGDSFVFEPGLGRLSYQLVS